MERQRANRDARDAAVSQLVASDDETQPPDGFGAEEEDLLLLELLRLSLLLRPLSRCSLQARILSKNEEELELELPRLDPLRLDDFESSSNKSSITSTSSVASAYCKANTLI